MSVKEILQNYYELACLSKSGELEGDLYSRYWRVRKYLQSKELFPIIHAYYLDRNTLEQIADIKNVSVKTISRMRDREINKLEGFVSGKWLHELHSKEAPHVLDYKAL